MYWMPILTFSSLVVVPYETIPIPERVLFLSSLQGTW